MTTNRSLISYDNLVHALAGAAGSVTAMSVFYPLDTVRSLLQVDEKRRSLNTVSMIIQIIEEEGFSSLYRGLFPVLTTICASNFVYFYTFHGLKGQYSGQNAPRDLLLASVAGIVNVVATAPLWVVNTRIKLQGAKLKTPGLHSAVKYNGIIDGLIKIGMLEGVSGLWSGMLPSLLLVSNPAIQFMVYEAIKRNLQAVYDSKELSSLTYFCIGALAKTAATFATYPLQILQSKLRYANKTYGNEERGSILRMLLYIIRSQGLSGLYKGLEAKLLQTVLTAALMFLCYEKIAALVFLLLKGASQN